MESTMFLCEDGVIRFFEEVSDRLVVNFDKLMAVAKKHLDWAESHRADLRDVVWVRDNLMLCLKRFESCCHPLSDEDMYEYGDQLDMDGEEL